MRRSTAVSLLACAALVFVSCDDGGTEPRAPSGPGTMVVHLHDAPESLGIVSLRLAGPVDGAVEAPEGVLVWERTTDAGERGLLVTGSLTEGVLLRFETLDRRAEFEVEVVAAGADASGGYGVFAVDALSLRVEPE